MMALMAAVLLPHAQGQYAIVDPPTYSPGAGSGTPEGKEVASEMDSLIIPRVDFHNTDISDVVHSLNGEIKKLAPAGQQAIFIWMPPSLAEGSAQKFYHRNVSITLENVPLRDVLAYIDNQTNLIYEIAPNREIHLYSAEFEKACQNTVKAIANFKIDQVDFKRTGIEDFVAALDAKCRQANPGGMNLRVIYRPRPDDPPLAKIRDKTVTMTLHDAPLLDILQDATGRTDFEFVVEPNTVVIRPGRSDD
jgi:hypothetical protein